MQPAPRRFDSQIANKTIAEHLAAFVCDTTSIPDKTREAAVKCVFDLVAAAIAGYPTANALAVRRSAPAIWGAGESAIWFSGARSTAAGSTFVNAAQSCSLDLDDGHRKAAGHPGAAIIPAVFTALAGGKENTQRALRAIALGYEIGVRISGARDLKTIPTVNTGLWAGQAAAAALGALHGVSPQELAQAIAIAGNTAPSQTATPYTKYRGNSVKEGIPWGAANGVLAVTLARNGFTGPLDILDNPKLFDPAVLLGNLGASWMIEGTYYKPYSCCRWLHAPVDALLMLMDENGLRADDIDKIEVETFGRTLTLGNEVAPRTLEGGQYSLPFCLGVAATSGAAALLPLSESSLADAKALALSARVEMRVDPEFDAMFSASVPGRVRLVTKRGRFERTVREPKGEPVNPMNWGDIESKFKAIAPSRIGAAATARLLDGVDAFRDGDGTALAVALAERLFER